MDRYNQFGGKLGGPVLIPGLYNGHDKTFFFFNYEGLRRQIPYNNLSTIPDEAFRRGDFSRSPVPIIDPSTGQQFPGNRVPAERLDPAAVRILSMLPAPNSPGSPDAANGRTINNHLSAGSTGVVDNQYTFRGDHSLLTTSRLFGRLTYFKVENPSAPIIPATWIPAWATA